jgi:hypothetical protein
MIGLDAAPAAVQRFVRPTSNAASIALLPTALGISAATPVGFQSAERDEPPLTKMDVRPAAIIAWQVATGTAVGNQQHSPGGLR